jgi:hypothetical protein
VSHAHEERYLFHGIPVGLWLDFAYSVSRAVDYVPCGLDCYRLCGLVVRVLGYRSGGPGSILGTTRKKAMGLERGPLSLVSTTEELLDRKVAAPV